MKKIHLYLHVITSSKNTWNVECSTAKMRRKVEWTDPNTKQAWQRASESVEQVFEGLRRFRSRNCRKRRQFEDGSSWMGRRCHISNEMCWKRWGMSPRYEGHVSNRIETIVNRKGVEMRWNANFRAQRHSDHISGLSSMPSMENSWRLWEKATVRVYEPPTCSSPASNAQNLIYEALVPTVALPGRCVSMSLPAGVKMYGTRPRALTWTLLKTLLKGSRWWKMSGLLKCLLGLLVPRKLTLLLHPHAKQSGTWPLTYPPVHS